MPADDTPTASRNSRTPSPGPNEQPSSGLNPVFDPLPPKRRGGQPISIKVNRQRLEKKEAEKEQEAWTPEQPAAQRSRIMQDKLAAAAAEKTAREAAAAAKAERERTARSSLRAVSKQASRLMTDHGAEFLDLLRAKRPEVVEKWALKVSLPVIAAEGERLSESLRPDSTREFTSRLETWLLEKMLSEATIAAPNSCEMLMLMGMTSDVGREDNKLVLVTVLCMLAQAQNKRANQFQEIMGTYFRGPSYESRICRFICQFEVISNSGVG
ncbi:hypothetical protein B0H13DRAFT_1881966 [Mycena leptocephala]|nr:hypothetical protein B0H13DRAFT_1881966 [Mycena leptocephala]